MIALLKKFFGSSEIPVDIPADRPGPVPDGWNKTVSDLMQELKEGSRHSIDIKEIEWAREYTRSLIPGTLRYPKGGDLYEALNDQTIRYLTHWLAPYTRGGSGTIFKGEQIWIAGDPGHAKPIGVYALPVHYKEVEMRMVAETDYTAPGYDCFTFSVDTIDLNSNFKLVQTGFSKEKFA